MWKASIRSAALLACLGLGACASGPSTPSGTAARAKAPPKAEAEFKQAVVALQNGRDDDAQRLLLDLTHQYPKLAGPFTNLGLLYLKEGKLPKAQQALLQATTARPDDAVAYNQLGVVYRKLGKFKQAQQAYEQALKLKPNYADAHLNLGILYDVYFNDLAQALVHYEKYETLTANPDKMVAKWIIDLKRRVKKQQTKAAS